MQPIKSLATLATLSLSVLTINSQTADAASFQGLGAGSSVSDISSDGKTVIGQSSSTTATSAFLWTEQTGFTVIPVNGFFPNAVSANGQVVVGNRSATGEILRWSTSQGTTILGPDGFADGISADGSIVVGYTGRPSSTTAPFRWTPETGLVDLGLPASGSFGFQGATDVSDDGAIIVGYSSDPITGALLPAQWTEQTGFTQLQLLLLDNQSFGAASSVSADSSSIVGIAGSANGTPNGEAFLWSDQQNIGLGDLQNGDGISLALDLSDDGSVVVGISTSDQGIASDFSHPVFRLEKQEAFMWHRQNGIRSVKRVLTDDFALDLTGWTLQSATGVSADGLTLVGDGINPDGQAEGWIAQLDPTVSTATSVPGPGVLPGVVSVALGSLFIGKRRMD